MIDSDNLRTASLYINNQLLSRGLLRDGRSIDFDRPYGDDHELADTMGRIMGVVNDLILRRDVRFSPCPFASFLLSHIANKDSFFPQRDAEHRESLSNTLRTLRADSLRQIDHLSRLQERYTEAQRKVDIADAQEATLKAQLKAAEATIHKLKDDAARTKKLVAETRATCANDVRKRDRQIEGLKKAVAEAGRARGERKSAGITTIQVTGDFGGNEMDDEYDLRQESNGHLAHLAKGLSEENDKMKALMQQTFDSLKKMSGWSKNEDESTISVAGAANGASQAIAPPPANPEELATDLQSVVVYVRNIISNPSYVPIEEFNEEVEVRDQEIFRLRDGWEKMEIRWQEAVRLIDGWRRRMAADGRPVDMEELKMGLRLSPVRMPDFEATAQDEPFKLSTLLEEEEEQSSFAQRQGSPSPPESLHLVPADDYQDMVPEYGHDQDVLDDSDSESSIFQDDVDMDDESEEPNFEILQHSATNTEEDSPSAPLPPPPKITALEETNLAGNRKPSAMLAEKSRKRSGNLLEENFEDTAKAPVPPPHVTQVGHSPQKRLKTSRDVSHEQPSSRSSSGLYAESNSSLDSVLLLEPPPEAAATKALSKPTTRPTRPATTTSRKPATAPVRASVKTVRTVAPEKKEKETPAKPLTRQRSTRATAPTAPSSSSSSSRPTRSKPEPPKTRTSTTTSSSTTHMPPPPRPTRSASNSSPAVQQPQPQTQQPDKRSSPPDTNVVHHPTSTTKRSQPPPPESPCRSPPKSSSRLPRKAPPHLLPTSQQSPVTVARIAAKLAASEREANAARVRAKLKAAKMGGKGGGSSATSSTSTMASSSRVASSGDGDPIRGGVRDVSGSTVLSSTSAGSVSMDENGTAGGVSILNNKTETNSAASSSHSARDTASETDGRETIVPSPAKRRAGAAPPAAAAAATPRKGEESSVKDGKRKREVRSRAERVASRRRSTLNPWELQSLITGDVPVPPTPGAVEQEA